MYPIKHLYDVRDYTKYMYYVQYGHIQGDKLVSFVPSGLIFDFLSFRVKEVITPTYQ